MIKTKNLHVAILSSFASLLPISNTLAETDDKPIESIVVVGSHIKGASITGTLPVSVIDSDDIAASGVITFEELLATLPQAGERFFNSERELSNDVRGDVASLNLRTLGADATLVLLNGRRMVSHPQTMTLFTGVPVQFVNMNALPTWGIGRIEILRDGASALYGSDAVAGVLNTVTYNDYEGVEASYRYGSSEGVSLDEHQARLHGGVKLNEGRTHIGFSAGYYNRTGLDASERSYSQDADKRSLIDPDSPFFGNFRLRNNSSFSAWGEFEAGFADPTQADGHSGVGVSLDGTTITSSGGRFHLQPDIASGGIAFLDGIELDDGSLTLFSNEVNGINVLRYNQNQTRKLTPDTERFNTSLSISHIHDNGWEGFADFIYYNSKSSKYFGPPVLSTSNNFVIPADYYWNPFGTSDQRLDGIDAPAEGYDILVRRFRFTEIEQRNIDISQNQWRALAGGRGEINGWDVETAVAYSASSATDVGLLVSRSLLFAELSKTTSDAYNIFNGGDTLNPASSAGFAVDVTRHSRNTLATWDLRTSNDNVFSLPAGNVGVAMGIEWRRETINDDRDERLDGTTTFTNPLTGEFFDSDILGVSGTPDLEASRKVYSAYGEAIVPLVSNAPLMEALTAQLAARFENYSDVDGSVVKPRFALSWVVAGGLQIRGAYSKNFRAPSLVQINQPEFSRFTNFQQDYAACTLKDMCDEDAVISKISGNAELGNEESNSLNIGFTYQPDMLQGLTLTADYWEIDLVGSVGLIGRNNHLALDEFLRRTAGTSNTAVVRADATADDIAAIEAYNLANGTNITAFGDVLFVSDQFLNLQPRHVSGYDFNITYLLETDIGAFTYKLNASRLTSYFQEASPQILELLGDAISADNVDPETVGELLEVQSRPKWRFNTSLRWDYENWAFGTTANFVGKVFDPFITATLDDGSKIPFTVESWLTIDAFAQYEIAGDTMADGAILRLGVRNIGNQDPPLYDSSSGYNAGLHNNRGRYWYFDISKAF